MMVCRCPTTRRPSAARVSTGCPLDERPLPAFYAPVFVLVPLLLLLLIPLQNPRESCQTFYGDFSLAVLPQAFLHAQQGLEGLNLGHIEVPEVCGHFVAACFAGGGLLLAVSRSGVTLHPPNRSVFSVRSRSLGR